MSLGSYGILNVETLFFIGSWDPGFCSFDFCVGSSGEESWILSCFCRGSCGILDPEVVILRGMLGDLDPEILFYFALDP